MAEASGQGEPAASKDAAAVLAIERAERAFAAGDHRAVQRELAALQGERDAALRARAAKLAHALNPDPALIAVLVGCLLALFAVFAHYVLGAAR